MKILLEILITLVIIFVFLSQSRQQNVSTSGLRLMYPSQNRVYVLPSSYVDFASVNQKNNVSSIFIQSYVVGSSDLLELGNRLTSKGLEEQEDAVVTYYHDSLHGLPMACFLYSPYRREDITVLAIGTYHYEQWPCGTKLRITGPPGTISVVRSDSCPGCGKHYLDLSEAGMVAVCGELGKCRVKIERIP